MTQEQKRIKIAEACGWVQQKSKGQCKINVAFPDREDWRPMDVWVHLSKEWKEHVSVPDYFNDLNAMHEAEKTLVDHQHLLFRKALWDVVIDDENDTEWDRCWISSTATQRAEAFGKTLNLW